MEREDVCQQSTECARDAQTSIAAEFKPPVCLIFRFDSFALGHDRLVLSVRPTGQSNPTDDL